MPGSEDSNKVAKMELKRAEVSDVLSRDAAFANAPIVKLLGVASLGKGRLRRIADKAVLFQQGDAGDSLFIVVAGEARLFARKDRDSVELGHAHKGEVIGEGSVLEGGVRKTSAVAQGQLDVIEVPRDALLNAGVLLPALKSMLSEVFSRRTRALDEMNDFMNRW